MELILLAGLAWIVWAIYCEVFDRASRRRAAEEYHRERWMREFERRHNH